jgi:hypothetical protein
MSSTLTKSDPTLRDKLDAVERDLAQLRERRAVAARERDDAQAAFARRPDYDVSPAEFRKAEAAVKHVGGIDDQIEKTQQAQTGLLRMISGHTSVDKAAIESGDVRQPGAWLSRIAMKATLTTDVGSTTDIGGPFIDRLERASALLASGPTRWTSRRRASGSRGSPRR